jgi:hypothetical protein
MNKIILEEESVIKINVIEDSICNIKNKYIEHLDITIEDGVTFILNEYSEIEKREYLFIAAEKKEGEEKYTPVASIWLQTSLKEPIAIISNEVIYYNKAAWTEIQNNVNLIKDLQIECTDIEKG